MSHQKAIRFAFDTGKLSSAQQSGLRKGLEQLLTSGLDWQSALRREFQATATATGLSSEATEALARIGPLYVKALNDPTELPELQKIIENASKPVPDIVPSAKRVIAEKQELRDTLQGTRSILQK
jgi:hypothetical protein